MDWSDRTVLVTGADGFIGSHLVEELLHKGSQVVAVVRRTSRSQITNRFQNLSATTVRALHGLIHLDLAGPGVTNELATAEADTWFHLAADAYVPASLHQPAAVVSANIDSTVNVLEAARVLRPEHVLITSSSEIYGSHEEPITESHPMQPATPYAASKVACDRIAWAYHNTFPVPLTIVRPFNCYGPRHAYDVVPLFLVRALRGEPLIVNGTGRQSRDLTYVSDTVDAFLRLAGLPPTGQAYNIGTGAHHQVLELARMTLELSGSRSEIRHAPPRAGEVNRLQADAAKLRSATGWTPRHELAAGLQLNLDWMREHQELL